MEQEEFTKMKDTGQVPSERTNAENETTETKHSKNVASENKNVDKGTPDTGGSDIASKSSHSRLNSPSNVVKDRGKTEHGDASRAYCNIPLTKTKQEFRASAKYRDMESYGNQHHHSIGEGLYLTDEIEDLPPRFRTKVIQALENALVANNIKIDRNPLDFFTTYGDASNHSDQNPDKLVYIPPEARNSSPIKSDSASPLKTNFEKKSSDSHHQSNSYPRDKGNPPFSSDNLDSQIQPQNFRNKTGTKSKPPFSRTCYDNDYYGTRQRNSQGKFVQQNVQNSQTQKLDHHTKNVPVSHLPLKPFNHRSKFTSNSSDSYLPNSSYVNINTSVGNHQFDNEHDVETELMIDFYKSTCKPIQPPSDVEISCSPFEEASNTNHTSLTKEYKESSVSNKPMHYTNTDKYGKKITVDELFKQNEASSNSKLNKISDANSTVPCSDTRADVNSKPCDNKRTFPNSKTQYENKKSFKPQSQFSAINPISSHENKLPAGSSESSKYSVNRTDSSTRNSRYAAESGKGIKSGKNQFDKFSDKTSNSDENFQSSDAQQNLPKSSNYSRRDKFSKFNSISTPKHFASGWDKNYDSNSYTKSYHDKKKLPDNSGKILNITSETEETVLQNRTSVQNRQRSPSDSRSSISSSYSSKFHDKVPRHDDTRFNMQDNCRSNVRNVNSNHNSFESVSHQKPMHKQLDKGGEFNKKSNNYRYNTNKYSDSSNVLSDKSEFNNRSNNYRYNADKRSDSSSVLSDKSEFNNRCNNYKYNRDKCNDSSSVLSDKSEFNNRSNNYRCNKDKYSDSSSVLSDKSEFKNRPNNYRYNRDKCSDSSSVLSDKRSFSNNSISDETCSQGSSKSLTKATGNFDRKRNNKFYENSRLSSREQETSDRKNSSYSPGNHHHSNKTNSTNSRSSYTEEHKSRSTENERKTENDIRLCVERGFFVKVEVSEKADDVEHWMNLFKSIFQPFFELVSLERCCRFSSVLTLEFERKEHAFRGLDILHRRKKMLRLLLISNLLYRLIKPCNCKKKVQQDSIEYIEKHFKSALSVLDSKAEEVINCKSTPKNYNSNREINSAEIKMLESFEESKTNFAKLKEEIIRMVKDEAPKLEAVQELKHSFIRECTIFTRCLPIYSKKSEIVHMARFHSVSVIVAETGSGKSTQLVEYLLHSHGFEHGKIICTQPRKLAAISIAQFVSGQIGSAVGKIVGYDVGIEKKCNDETKIVFMTDYCLLKYFLRNRELKGVSCIIIDEAHERSLYTDLILGLLKERLNKRKELSVIITSATINPAIFVDYFDMPEECVIEVPGRTYPVDVVWFPEDVEIGWDYLDACVHQAYEVHVSQKEGDILVFLTSPSESEEAIYLFKKLLSKKDNYREKNKVELLSLHGKTDIQEQMKIFQKTSKFFRKIIFATNVAETAVTIPGIKYVVDSGMNKELMFDPQKNKSYLTVTFTTKSAAEQRKGRAGRTQSGICYRMYSKRNFAENMPDNSVPEILKSNLQKALLKIFELGIDPENFDFIEAPPGRTISNSVESLEHLGAIANKKLTNFGKKLVKLPLEPQLSKLVLQGIEAKIGIESIITAALVSESGKLFIRNEENRAVADEKKRQFCHGGGDLCTFLEIYKKWKEVDIPQRYEWCVENFLSFKALSAAAKTVKEILITLRTELGLHVSSRYNNIEYKKQYEQIIFDSFSENLCVLSGHPKLGYLSPYLSESFFIHPSSTLSYLGKDSPEFLVYSTLMETSRNFLFDVTPISEATLKSAYQAGKFRLPLHTLRCLQVPPKIMGPYGESVLIRHILGKGGSKIRDLEKALLYLTSVKNLYVDVDVTKGLITIYLSNRLHEKVESHVQQIINAALDEMVKEEDIVKLSGTSLYFGLTVGGIVNDIIMPGEFRELVFNHVQSKDSCELENTLQTYGPLQSISRVTSKQNNQEMQIYATFKKVCDAKKAFLDLKQGKKINVSPKPHLPNVVNKKLPLHMLLMSWCCRPCTGFGSVQLFSEADLIIASGQLTYNSFFIENNLIMFQVADEKKHILSMKNLPEFVEESTVREKLKEALPDIKVKSIDIFRRKVVFTEDVIEKTKTKLIKLLSIYVANTKFTIDLKYPESRDALWNAAVYFENAADAENTYMKLKGTTCIDSYPLSVRLTFKRYLYCNKNVFDLVSVQVNDILNNGKAAGNCVESSVKLLDGEIFNVQIEFSCINLKNLHKISQDLLQFLEGDCMNLIANPKYHFIFTEGLVEQIKKIQKLTKTKISLDKIKKTISIYGPPANCQKAKGEIYQLAHNRDYSFTRTFNLRDSCIPYGFLKDLYSKYGYDLHGLAAEFRLTVASIDNFGHTLTLKGSKEQIRKAERALEKMCEELFRSRGKRRKPNTDEEDCPICFDPVSFDFQRLEHCGHAFCRQCLVLQVESKTLPLVCVKENCGKLIFLEDIKRMISFGGDHLKKEFCAVALQHHVSSNIGKLSYCRTPDCQMIYRVTKEGSEYNCPGCKNATCTRCQSAYHYGMSCEMFQKCQKDVDYSLKTWMKENESSRKYCPSCKVGIEKSEGCNHMQCLSCKAHLCWLCLEIFETGDAVYTHLPYCPKNQ